MRAKILFVMLVFSLINMCPVNAEESLQADVKGNATRFSYDKETGALQLADCRVMEVTALHYAWSQSSGPDLQNPHPWDVPVEYRNPQSAQALFDEMIAAESVKGKTVPHPNAGLTIVATPPNDISRFVSIGLMPATSMDGQFCNDIVSVIMVVHQNGKTIHDFVLRSSKLCELVVKMSESPFGLQDTSSATVAMMCATPYPQYLQPDIETPKTEIIDDVRRITDVLLNATPISDANIEHFDEQQLLLWLEDGRRMNVYIGGCFYLDDRDTDVQRKRVFIRAGSQYYEVDAMALNHALRSAGLLTLDRLD